jgi:signal transduction histidine kinase
MKLFKSFLKDQIIDSIIYFTACFLIGLFYYIDTGRSIEILYPLSIVLFVYLIWMLLRLIQYYNLYQGLDKMAKYHDYSYLIQTELQKRIRDTIMQLHTQYMGQLSEVENIRKKDRRFLSMWIHNMKTPVTVTDLVLQRMNQQEIDPVSGTKALKEENRKLLYSLDQVLNMLRLEEFAKDYAPEPFDLLEEINAIINKNKSLFIYSHVFPKIVNELKEAVVLSDRKWNQLMLEQIISNGVKYSNMEDGISKSIYFYIEKSEKNISLIIRDEGIGIPQHDLSKVCEPFFTGENGRKGFGSSGIGLYFCQEVCRLLGHTLEITSEEGKGTTVKVTYLAKL